jgi:uncharacterized DUF497 family protein
LRITDIIWKERVVEKTAEKHAVSVAEAEEALLSRPVVRKMAKGRVHGEDVYAALAQTSSGRYLISSSSTRSAAWRCQFRHATWTLRRGHIMPHTDSQVDPLPDDFKSEDEAAEFWDNHSITDYEEFLEPVGLEVDLKRRHFEIEVDRESFLALRDSARKLQKPVKQLASEILKQKLAAV